jgi:hypothetical protein
MGRISGPTRIAGHYTVDHWRGIRSRFLDDPALADRSSWQHAFQIFRRRVETRFLKPITKILSGGNLEGEGFAVAALQAILVEFLEAFYQGKIYAPPVSEEELGQRAAELRISREELDRHEQPGEYHSSSRLVREFLTTHKPFCHEFNHATAAAYYRNIRCGLLHEAATKGGTLIRGDQKHRLITPLPGGDIILHRTGFQHALESYISAYGAELESSASIQRAFLRKMDDICQIRRVYYFAYGSNMNTAQMRRRARVIHGQVTGHIKGYVFCYNKRGSDGTSKANIVFQEQQVTRGVCFEIEEDSYGRLREIEKGYRPINVLFYTETGSMIIARTFISEVYSDDPPAREYVDTVVAGATENGLPADYVATTLVNAERRSQ